MQHTRKKSKLFYKYLFSYISILLIPFVILGVFIFSYFINLLKKEVLINNLNVLDRAKNVIESQLTQLSGVKDQIFVNHNLKHFYLENETNSAIITINELKNYIVMNPFIEDIIYYNRGDDFLYTSTSSCSLSLFVKSIYPYENWDLEKFTKDINSITVPTYRAMENVILPSGTKKRFITYMYPIRTNGFKVDRTVLFIIPENSFSILLKNSLKEYEGISVILDENNQIITGNGTRDYFKADSFSDLLSSKENSLNKTITIQKQKYLLSYIKSKETNWKYITLVPTRNVMKDVNTVQFVSVCGLLLVLFIGSAIIYFMMYLNYKPIEKLKLYSQGILRNAKDTSNDLDTVRNTIDFLNAQNSKLNIELESHTFAAKDFLLSKLIKGQINSIEELITKGSSIGLVFGKPVFRVVVFCMKTMNNINTEGLINDIEKSLPKDITGYARSQTEENNIVLLLSIDREREDYVNDSLILLQKKLYEKTGFIITLGAGNSCTDILNIPKSFMEAMTAIDYRLVKGVDRVIFFNEINIDQSTINSYLHFVPEKLKFVIKQGDMEQVENIVNDTLNFLKQNNTPILIARLLCYDIINTVVKAINEINHQHPLSKEVYPDVFALSKFETVDELSEIVRKISQDVDQCIRLKENSSNTINLILEYIQSNYSDCSFSVQQVADNFQLSLQNLSQYFKEQTGYNIIDYATNLKIEKAKHLLSSTELQLKDVSIQVGYYNVTSFIRRFKQVTGCTPGEYRKNN